MFLFIFDRDSTSGGGAERERQNGKQAPGSELSAEPDVGLKLTDCEIVTWAKVRHSTNWTTQAPLILLFETNFRKEPFLFCVIFIYLDV